MKKFPIRIQRDASYREYVDAIVVAKTKDAAIKIAEGIGNGENPNWPSIERYNTSSAQPVHYELIDMEVHEPQNS